MLKLKRSSGLSLIELLISVAIIGLIVIITMVFLRNQLARSRDAKRKADLDDIKIAFEDYYNDNGCYPPAEVLDDCDQASFKPYLSKVPCDPSSKKPYVYVPLAGSACKGYRVLTILEETADPVITELNCNSACGCGFGAAYNYGVSAGTTVAQDGCEPIAITSPSPTPSGASASPASSPAASPSPGGPSPSPSPVYAYACDPGGVCNRYDINNVPGYCDYSFSTPAECEAASGTMVDGNRVYCCEQ